MSLYNYRSEKLDKSIEQHYKSELNVDFSQENQTLLEFVASRLTSSPASPRVLRAVASFFKQAPAKGVVQGLHRARASPRSIGALIGVQQKRGGRSEMPC